MNKLLQYIPSSLRRFVRVIVYSSTDIYHAVTGTRKAMCPPAMTSLLVGGGDFQSIGKQIKDDLVATTKLHGRSTVLEVGCGYGRVAAALTGFICEPGRYDGVDIVRKAVDWCAKEITLRYPNFTFYHADVANPYAGQKVGRAPTSYRLPFENDTYDVVFLTSVFSHMRPDDIKSYLSEVARVMKPGGRCFITYYLVDGFSLGQIAAKKSSQDFRYDFGTFLSTHKRVPEQTIALAETLVRGFYKDAALMIDEPILYGSWSNRENYFSYQDVIVATKPE